MTHKPTDETSLAVVSINLSDERSKSILREAAPDFVSSSLKLQASSFKPQARGQLSSVLLALVAAGSDETLPL